MRFKGVLVIVLLTLLCVPATQSYAETYSLVKTIDLLPLVGDDGSIEVDVVGNELFVANWIQDKYFIINPITDELIDSFSLGNGILIDNHGSEYNPTTGLILHASDQDAGGTLGSYDAFFATNTNGQVVGETYRLFGPSYPAIDPDGLTVDPVSGRVWVSGQSGLGGIIEIDPTNGTMKNHIDQNFSAAALAFNPISRTIFFADADDWTIKEIATDGTGMRTVFNPDVGWILGMAFTPTGDLVLLDFAGVSSGLPLPSQLLLYDSSYDPDRIFTTRAPVTITIDIKPGSDPNSINPKSKGNIPVAILSTQAFNAVQMVNKDSLTFGFTGEEDSLAFCNHRGEDINGDGLEDLICHFNTQDTGFICGDLEGILKGETTDGIPIEGSDPVRIVPCKN